MQKVKVYTEGTPAFLPSSLTNIVPGALGFSPHPPVSVCGTGTITPNCDAFLGTLVGANSPCGVSPCVRAYSIAPAPYGAGVNIRAADLPTAPPYAHSNAHSHSTPALPGCVPPQIMSWWLRNINRIFHRVDPLGPTLRID